MANDGFVLGGHSSMRRYQPRCQSRMARPPNPPHRTIQPRQQLRHYRPHRCRQDGRPVGSANRGRKPRRRQHDHRHGCGRKGCTGRLYAWTRQHLHARRQHCALPQSAVRSSERFCPGCNDRHLALRADQLATTTGLHGQGRHQTCQGKGWLSQLRVRGYRYARSSCRRAFQMEGRHQCHPRTLSRQRPIHARSNAGPHRSFGQYNSADLATHPRG